MACQDVFHIAADRYLAPAYHRYDAHQLLVGRSAHVQGLAVGQFHFLEIGFPVVARTVPALAGCRFFRLRFLRCVIRFPSIWLAGYALRDKFPHEILVYLRHCAVLLCHIIVV